jgi:hypothetical protein
MSQNNGYRLSTVTDKSTITDASGAGTGPWSVTFRPDNYAIDRFYVGQRLDLLDATNTGKRKNGGNTTSWSTGATRVNLFVSAVDELRGYVTVTSTQWDFNGNTVSSAVTGVIANGDVVVYANSGSNAQSTGTQSFTGIAGINSWLKFGDGTTDNNAANLLLGDESDNNNRINVAIHPEFKSFGVSSVGTLTEHKLRQYIRRFHAAKNKYGQTIDCLIASDGVWLSYEAQKIGQYTLERQGKLSNVNNEGSDQGFKFTFEGRTYNGYTSTYIEDGVVYGIKKGGSNWKRYVPPDPKGVQKFSEADSFIPFNFVVPALTGTATTKFPILSGGLMTEAMQMPGMLRMQLVPDQAAGMKLSGVTTDRVWSST